MRRVNEMTVCREDYDSEVDFENAIKDAVMVLLNNNYIMTIKYLFYFFYLFSSFLYNKLT